MQPGSEHIPTSQTSERTTRDRVFQIVAYAVLLLMVAAIAARRDLRNAILSIDLQHLVGLGAVSVLGLACLGLQFRTASLVLDVRLDMKEWLGLTALNTLINLVLPARGGLALRAAYMKTVRSMTLSNYVALTAVSIGLLVGLACVTGTITALIILPRSIRFAGAAAFAGVGILIGVAAFTLPRIPIAQSRLRRFTALQHGLRLYGTGAPRLTLDLIAWTAALFLLQTTSVSIAFSAIGAELNLAEAVLIQSASTISFLVAITPGALGIKEGVVVFVGNALGVDLELALAAALVDRAATIGVTVVVALALGRGLINATLHRDDTEGGSAEP